MAALLCEHCRQRLLPALYIIAKAMAADGGVQRGRRALTAVHGVNRTLLSAARFIAKAMFVRDGARCSQLSLWTAPGIAKAML
jgi:hypothetical protein